MTVAAPTSVWAPGQRILTAGLLLTVSMAALEALAVATTMPATVAEIGGLNLYGWAFSGYMLAEILGIHFAGRAADTRGLAQPFAAGIALFSLGLLLAGSAGTMLHLVAGRVVQGLGAGAVFALSYAAVARAYSPEAQPRLLALQSTAWVAPSLIGPGIAGTVADHVGWRWVFLGLAPFAIATGFMVVPALHRLGRQSVSIERRAGGNAAAVALTVSCGVALAASQLPSALAAIGLGSAAVAAAVWSLRPLVPEGTLAARPGLPAAIATVALISAAFFGAEVFIPLALTQVRGQSSAFAGLVLTASALTWTAGSWMQERLASTTSRRGTTTAGALATAAGIAASGALLLDTVPPWLSLATWGLSGLGIGLSYTALSLTVLELTPPGEEGSSAAAFQLGHVLGTAIGTGVSGAVVAALATDVHAMRPAIAVAGAVALLLAGLGSVAATRLPGRSGAPPRPRPGAAPGTALRAA